MQFGTIFLGLKLHILIMSLKYPHKQRQASIVFNRTNWSNKPEWFTTGVNTPKAGSYTVLAAPQDSGLSASMNVTYVDAEFTEHSGHQYGFDDYTGWTEDAADYYGVRNDKCSVAYASVLELATDSGVVNLSLSPNPTPVDIDISASNYSRLTYSPLSRASSGRVDFDHVISGVNLYAKLNTTTLSIAS